MTYYVGETGRSFRQRFEEHTKEYLSGVYRVYDPVLFAQGIKELVWGGMWQRGRTHLWPDFLEEYVEIAPITYRFLTCLRVFLAPCRVEERVRERIEAAIAEAARNCDESARTFFDEGVQYRPRREEEEPFELINQADRVILGLEGSMQA